MTSKEAIGTSFVASRFFSCQASVVPALVIVHPSLLGLHIDWFVFLARKCLFFYGQDSYLYATQQLNSSRASEPRFASETMGGKYEPVQAACASALVDAVAEKAPQNEDISRTMTAPKAKRARSSGKKKNSSKKHKVKGKQGVVYMSRVPPGLDVGIVRSILGRVGPLGRVWLRAEEKETVAARRSLGGRRRAGFTDAWVEFLRIADAESAVELLNGQPMTGATRRGRFENDLWCLRLLPDFKWDDLVDEACGTRRERVLRVKSEVAASRRERSFVEQRAALAKRIERSERQKAKEAEDGLGCVDVKSGACDGSTDLKEIDALGGKRLVRRYRQKRPVSDPEGVQLRDVGEQSGLSRLERDEYGDGSAINTDLISKLFKKRRVGTE